MRFMDELEIQKQIERITKQKGFINVSDIEGIINSAPEAVKYFFTTDDKGETPFERIAKQNRFSKNDIKEILIKIPEAMKCYFTEDEKGKMPINRILVQYNFNNDDAKDIFGNLNVIRYFFTPDNKGIILAKQGMFKNADELNALIDMSPEATRYFFTLDEKGEIPFERIAKQYNDLDAYNLIEIINNPEATKYYFTPDEKGEIPFQKTVLQYDFSDDDIIKAMNNPIAAKYYFTPDEKGEMLIEKKDRYPSWAIW